MTKIDKYFNELNNKTNNIYSIAQKCREQQKDLKNHVEIPLSTDIGSRVEGLVSTICPQILNSGISVRIEELENIYPKLDWRIGLTIAEEVSDEKFCKFKNKTEAMEIGIRIGFSYLTLGVISAPLEGFINLEIKKREDGEDYICMNFAGPIRAAGGTAGAVSVLLCDYIRKHHNFSSYDINEKEINRFVTEVFDYDSKATKLQYLPSKDEIVMLVKNLGIEISGNQTEDLEVSNFKDLPRVLANKIRGGMCLVIAECLCQKAAKMNKRLNVWGGDFNLLNWNFLDDFVKLQKEKKSKGGKEDENKKQNEKNSSTKKVLQNWKFLEDVVSGRPIFTFPQEKGGFRLRYGRSRTTGFASSGISAQTFEILSDFLAVGTQLRLEYPGKSTIVSPVDNLESPIVKLENGSVIVLDSVKKARKYKDKIIEIIHLGDILISYGEFSEQNHPLMPNGYCEEEWELELEKKIEEKEKVQ